jgi:hypothetical protein
MSQEEAEQLQKITPAQVLAMFQAGFSADEQKYFSLTLLPPEPPTEKHDN